MNKFIIICFILLIFIGSVFLVRPSISSLLERKSLSDKVYYKTWEGVIASSLGIRNANSLHMYKNANEIVGEQVEVDLINGSINLILAKLGVRVVRIHKLSSFKMIEGVSALIPYKKLDGNDYNIELKCYQDKLIIGAPKII